MQGNVFLLLVLSVAGPALAGLPALSLAATKAGQTPVNSVVTLLIELKARIAADGVMQQKSYDKYACWCEHTLDRKARAIADAKKKIEKLLDLILKLSADLGSHGAEVKQLEKDVAENVQAQKEATAAREKEYTEYEAEKFEAEQCLGALEAATNVLAGAGAGGKKGKAGFLQSQEAQIMGVAAGLRTAVQRATQVELVSVEDLEVVRDFVERPQQLLPAPRGAAAALQVGSKNPFGDYAPRSTAIQGILKSMYDAFAANLEKANGEEGDSQKAFEELMATKKQELETLKAALAQQTADEAAKTKLKADSKADLDATKKQLKADEKFFEETKLSCRQKATTWSMITRVRIEELESIAKAIEILSNPQAMKTFTGAYSDDGSEMSLLQLSSARLKYRDVFDTSDRDDAYTAVRSLASRYDSLGLAQIAAHLKAGGHFDKVIGMIDKMIALLRQEGQDDIEHRDRCESGVSKNKNDKEDLQQDIEKAKEELQVAQDRQQVTNQDLQALLSEIDATKQAMDDRLELRNGERKAFEEELRDDVNAVTLLGLAIQALVSFQSGEKLPITEESPAPVLLQLVQTPEYTIDKDKAPETTFGDEYTKKDERHSEKHGIIQMLEGLKEDFEKEVKTGREEDKEAQKKYLEDRAALKDTLGAQEASKLQLEKEMSERDAKMADLTTLLDLKDADLGKAKKMSDALAQDCAWVKTHFKSRRQKRQKEIEGLGEARDLLAGAEAA